MSALDVYSVAHKDEKSDFLYVVGIGEKLDKNDFAPNGYPVDETVYPRSLLKNADGSAVVVSASKAIAGSSNAPMAVGDDDDEHVRDAVPTIELSDSEPRASADSDAEETLAGEHLSPRVDKQVLEELRKTIRPQRLFTDSTVFPQSSKRQATSADSAGPSSSGSKSKVVTAEEVERMVSEKISQLQQSVLESAATTAKQLQESQERSEKAQSVWMQRQQELMEKQFENNQRTMDSFMKMFATVVLPLQSIAPPMLLTSGQTPTSSAAQVPPADPVPGPTLAHEDTSTQNSEPILDVPESKGADVDIHDEAPRAG